MRTWLFRLAAIALLCGLPPVLQTERAWACTCGYTSSPAESMQESEAVFAGKLIDAVFREQGESYMYDLLEFEVSLVWKGSPDSVVVLKQIFTSCSTGFTVGEEYIVYAIGYPRTFDPEDDHLSPDGVCGRTQRLANAEEDLDALGPGGPPEPGTMTPPAPSDAGTGMLSEPQSPDAWAIALLAAAAVALAGLGLAAVLRRARDG